MLAAGRSKVVEEFLQESIVEWPTDRRIADTEKTSHKSGEFEIPEMARHQDFWPLIEDDFQNSASIRNVKMLVPIASMHLPGSLRDLAEHQQEVVPHPESSFIDLLRRPIREDFF
jgi:hypothetical protein